MTPDEQQLFNDNNALVSTTRVIIGGTTYPLVNVSSVALRKKMPVVPYFLGGISGLVALGGFGSKEFGLALVAVIVAALIFVFVKPSYLLVLGTSGGEKTALRSPKKPYMMHLVETINTAIIRRG